MGRRDPRSFARRYAKLANSALKISQSPDAGGLCCTHRRSPAACTIAKDGKHFKGNERRFAYELVVADFSAHTSSRTIVIVVRSDILQLITNPVTVPATLDARHCQLNAELHSLGHSQRVLQHALRQFAGNRISARPRFRGVEVQLDDMIARFCQLVGEHSNFIRCRECHPDTEERYQLG